MNAEARNALRTIRRCVAEGRYRLMRHFRVRMAQRGMCWPDVLVVIDTPTDARPDGIDDAGRSRWIVSGQSADGIGMELVCAIGRDAAGELTVFITAYWE